MKRKLFTILVAALATVGLTVLPATSANAASAHRHTSHRVGYTQVVVAPAVYDLVTKAGIVPAPVDGAKASAYKGTLAAQFPITGYQFRNVRITHSGGISLTAGSATIALRNFYIDLGRGKVSAEVNGSIGNVGRVDLFTIGFSNRYDLGLVKLKLTSTAAGALNTTFGVDAFAAGATFGYATPRPFARF